MFDFPPWLLVEFCQFNRRAIDMPSQAASLQTQTIPPRRHIQAGGSPETNVNSGHPSRVDLDNARNYHGVGLLACGDIAPCTGRLRTIGRGHPRQGRMGIALGGPLGCDRTVCQGRRLDARGADADVWRAKPAAINLKPPHNFQERTRLRDDLSCRPHASRTSGVTDVASSGPTSGNAIKALARLIGAVPSHDHSIKV